MKRILPYLVGLTLAAAVFFIQESRIQALKADNATAQEKLGYKSANRADENIGRSNSEIAPPLESSRGSITVIRPDKPTTRNLEKLNDFRKGVAELFENEAGQAMIKQGVKMSLPILYGDLIDSFGLDTEEKKHFNALLTDRITTQQLLGMKWMQAEPGEKKALEEKMETAKKESTAAINDFLNSEEDSEVFQQYEKQLPERQTLGALRESFADNPLPPETEESLVGLLYESRINSGDGEFGEDQVWATISETGDLEAVKQRWEATDELIRSGLPDVLEDGQIEAFEKYWAGVRQVQAMQYQMALQMFQNQTK